MKNILLIMLILVSSITLHAKPIVPQAIINSITTGDAKALSDFFSESIELTIADKTTVCTKIHAKQILKKFFEQSIPSKFKIVVENEKAEQKYVIGVLSTNNGEFRIYFSVNNESGKDLIQNLKVEKM